MTRAIWLVVLGVVLGVFVAVPVSYAAASSGGVSVSAQVEPTVFLHITTPGADQSVDFGAVEPGVLTAPQSVALAVSSNLPYSISKTALDAAALGLATSLPDSSENPKTAAAQFTDVYMLDAPYATPPGSYGATVQYTVVQE